MLRAGEAGLGAVGTWNPEAPHGPTALTVAWVATLEPVGVSYGKCVTTRFRVLVLAVREILGHNSNPALFLKIPFCIFSLTIPVFWLISCRGSAYLKQCRGSRSPPRGAVSLCRVRIRNFPHGSVPYPSNCGIFGLISLTSWNSYK